MKTKMSKKKFTEQVIRICDAINSRVNKLQERIERIEDGLFLEFYPYVPRRINGKDVNVKTSAPNETASGCSEQLIPVGDYTARMRKQAEEDKEQQIKESVNSMFMEKGADAAFVVDKFENYTDNQETVQESTQNTAILEEYQPFEVEPGAVVDGVKIDATDESDQE